MKIVIWPEIGDLILDLRYVQSDGNTVPAMVAVDENGQIRSQGKITEVRPGGGHGELFRFVIAGDIGFDQLPDGNVKIHPEGV